MVRIDSVIIESMELAASWASIADAHNLRGRILSGEILSLFDQAEREAF